MSVPTCLRGRIRPDTVAIRWRDNVTSHVVSRCAASGWTERYFGNVGLRLIAARCAPVHAASPTKVATPSRNNAPPNVKQAQQQLLAFGQGHVSLLNRTLFSHTPLTPGAAAPTQPSFGMEYSAASPGIRNVLPLALESRSSVSPELKP